MTAGLFLNDIPASLALDAYRGTSFSPERRAESTRTEYAAQLANDWSNLHELALANQTVDLLPGQFERYREGYGKRYKAYLASSSRCVSSMIAGPSNFPARRMNKRAEIAHKRLEEMLEFRERALQAIRRVLCPQAGPIMAGDSDAVQRLRAHPIAPFTLTNNGANIRRMKARLAMIETAKAKPDEIIEGANSIRYEDCPGDNRVRLFFPGKPTEAVRSVLKSSGFRWTPSLGCWQAYRNTRSIGIAREQAGGADFLRERLNAGKMIV